MHIMIHLVKVKVSCCTISWKLLQIPAFY